MTDAVRSIYASKADFEAAWEETGVAPRTPLPLDAIASHVNGGLLREGFRLFHNSGVPLLERRRGALREEIVFVPRPNPGVGHPFAVRVHVSHSGVADVRSRYWRPAVRAPMVVAAGDIGLLEPEPIRAIWRDAGTQRTGDAILRIVRDHVMPWIDPFDDPPELRTRLEEGSMRFVDPSTALELILAEMGIREARRFLRSSVDAERLLGVAPESQGFDLESDRLATIAAYFRL